MGAPLADETTYELGDWRGNWVDDFGVTWKVRKETGWSTSAPAKPRRSPRPDGHGSRRGRGFRDERQILLEGVAQAPDPVIRDQAKDRFTAVLGDGADLVRLTVNDRHMTRHAMVELDGIADTIDVQPTVFEWRLPLVAPDPRRYGPERGEPIAPRLDTSALVYPLYGAGVLDYGDPGSTGRVTLTNEGKADTWATFDVVGPVPAEGFELTELTTGRRLRYVGLLGPGQLLTLDSQRGRVLLEGNQDRRSQLTVDQWWSIPPGQSRTVLFTLLGSYEPGALLVPRYAPAWW